MRNSTLGSLVAGITAQAYSSTVMMRGNQITEIVPDSFRGTDQIVGRLDLSSNQLTRVNFSAFDSFTQLQVWKIWESITNSTIVLSNIYYCLHTVFDKIGSESGRKSTDKH